MINLEELGVTTKFSPPVDYGVAIYAYDAPTTNAINLIDVILPTTSAAIDLREGAAAHWAFEAAKKLENLGTLRQNWDSYGGLPLSPNAKRITFDALGWLKNQDLPVPAVVLGSAGTVHLEWRSKGRELEIGFGPTEAIEYVKIDNQGHIEEGEADAEIRQRLRMLTSWLVNG